LGELGLVADAFGEDAFGRRAEAAARFFGTPKYIIGQTLIVIAWIAVNAFAFSFRLGPLPVHLAEPSLLHPSRLRRTADPARTNPASRPRKDSTRLAWTPVVGRHLPG